MAVGLLVSKAGAVAVAWNGMDGKGERGDPINGCGIMRDEDEINHGG